ncbi:MAG: hypothetical protein V4602_05195 [Pseudomonadota bacterium]
MKILSFFRRTKSRYANDKSVADFERVLKRTRPPTSEEQSDAIANEMARLDELFTKKP